MFENEEDKFDKFIRPLLGMPVSHFWRGYGSAIFLEFGKLSDRTRANGRKGNNPCGEWTLMIQWSWRLEGKRRIWCGSWSDDEKWPSLLGRLVGVNVSDIVLFGRLPEVSVAFSNGLHLLSLMTADGDPSWGLTKREGGLTNFVGVRAGRLYFDEDALSIQREIKPQG
jgi:hypothetical protein